MLNAARSKKINKDYFKPRIVFQDKSVLIINKPAGWVTLNVASWSGPTIQNWLNDSRQLEKNTAARRRSGIVHRLDKDTWGLLLVAKTNPAYKNLQAQFKNRKVRKIYWALISGELKGEGEILAPIGRSAKDGTQFDVVPGGRPAHTLFQVKDHYRYKGDIYSLVRVKLRTGRTHQIRVHFKYLGHPVFGDPIYGKKEEVMFLVAKEIGFRHPVSADKMNFKIELPDPLNLILNQANEKKKN